MVKVLQSGVTPREKLYQTACKRCACVFEFARMEARYIDDQRDGDAVVINCPECDDECWVAA